MQPSSPTDNELEQVVAEISWVISCHYDGCTPASIRLRILAALKGVRDRSVADGGWKACALAEVSKVVGKQALIEHLELITATQQARINQLEAALREIANDDESFGGKLKHIARAALSPEPTPVIPEVMRDMSPDQRQEFVRQFNALTGEQAMEMARKGREVYPSKPVRCPYGSHLIFVRPSGSIVAHYASEGDRCKGSERQYCDCHLRAQQVCDICQGIGGDKEALYD